ncbi:MAG: CcmD family protein [Polyangiaceae bacterium]|nr:CcmD family protein [Polyangiaceae bacterium]
MQTPASTNPSPSPIHDDPGLGPGLVVPGVDTPPPATPADGATVALAEARSTAFVAIQDAADSSSATVPLVVAYVLMWVLVFAFVWLSFRRLASLDARLRDLEGRLERGRPSPGGDDP